LHALPGGEQATPAVQETHVPPLQTRLVPQLVPFPTDAPVSVQVAAPLLQLSVPTWQGLAGVQGVPLVQATQLPFEQT
jgi:hypothetical protein